jgi:hypothetical protein
LGKQGFRRWSINIIGRCKNLSYLTFIRRSATFNNINILNAFYCMKENDEIKDNLDF